jgi:hypothetical protein
VFKTSGAGIDLVTSAASMQNNDAEQRHRTCERGHRIQLRSQPQRNAEHDSRSQTGADPVPSGLAVTNTDCSVLAQQVGS